MLTRVDISNYRGFKSYRMEGLTRVNLLVGKNNSGKTALLEGIQFLTSRGDLAVLPEIAKRRGELAFPVKEGARRGEPWVDIAHLFYGHVLAPTTSLAISGDHGYRPVRLSVRTGPFRGADAGAHGTSGNGTGNLFLRITIGGDAEDDREESGYRIHSEGAVDFANAAGKLGSQYTLRVYFVGPDSLSSRHLAAMWDEVTLMGQESEVAAAMRVIEPQCESVHPMTGMLASGHYGARSGFVVGVTGKDRRIPLGSMGDGMRRLMSLATALVYTQGGCLFVDEIDSGLHYSVMPDMWKLVTLKAVSLNTQVFATTHSWDCIEGLSVFCQQNPEVAKLAAIHKIDPAIPHSVPFEGEAIVRMVKADIDPR